MVGDKPVPASGVILENIFRLAVVALAAAVGWTFNAITDHEVRLVKIESNRFTSQDGQLLIRALEVKLQALEVKVVRTETKVDEMKAELRRLAEAIQGK